MTEPGPEALGTAGFPLMKVKTRGWGVGGGGGDKSDWLILLQLVNTAGKVVNYLLKFLAGIAHALPKAK